MGISRCRVGGSCKPLSNILGPYRLGWWCGGRTTPQNILIEMRVPHVFATFTYGMQKVTDHLRGFGHCFSTEIAEDLATLLDSGDHNTLEPADTAFRPVASIFIPCSFGHCC